MSRGSNVTASLTLRLYAKNGYGELYQSVSMETEYQSEGEINAVSFREGRRHIDRLKDEPKPLVRRSQCLIESV